MRSVLPTPLRRQGPAGRPLLTVFCAAWAALVGAAVPAARGGTGTTPAHSCRCGMDCRSACCCLPSTPVRIPESRPSPAPVRHRRLAAGPCLSSAPCSGEPASPSPIPRVRVLIGTDASCSPRPETAGRLLEALPSALSPAILAARLDDPPERPADA